MDYPNREAPSQAPAPRPVASAAARHHKSDDNHMGRIGVVAGIVVIALLLLGIIGVLAFSGPKAEDTFVDSSRLQAVFLNTGQVYFGNVSALNSKYVVLKNIYYLQTSSNGSSSASNSNTSVSLVKLGCELHEPLDQMVINRDQVTFWENLGSDGQVAKAVAQFEKQNPNGQKCASTSGNSTTSGSSAQPAPSTTTPSTNTTTNNATVKP